MGAGSTDLNPQNESIGALPSKEQQHEPRAGMIHPMRDSGEVDVLAVESIDMCAGEAAMTGSERITRQSKPITGEHRSLSYVHGPSTASIRARPVSTRSTHKPQGLYPGRRTQRPGHLGMGYQQQQGGDTSTFNAPSATGVTCIQAGRI